MEWKRILILKICKRWLVVDGIDKMGIKLRVFSVRRNIKTTGP